MIGNLEQICIAFYQGKASLAYEAFQQTLPFLIDYLEKNNCTAGVRMLHRILAETKKQDWVMVADLINFELIPVLQENGGQR